MARAKKPRAGNQPNVATSISATVDELRLAALESGDPLKTGRHLLTFKEGASAAGMKALQKRRGLRMASAADFDGQAVRFEEAAGADALVFPEIGVVLVSGTAAAEHGLTP